MMGPDSGSDAALASPSGQYAELHCHSNFSFQEGASRIRELVGRARELGYAALALTDHDNLCGAMEFARTAAARGVRPITGAEVTLTLACCPPVLTDRSGGQAGGAHLTLLAASAQGYRNLCRLISLAHVTTERRAPELDPRLLADHAAGLIALSGCAKGQVPHALAEGRLDEAGRLARQMREWFGEGNFYLEMQQNLVHGDTLRNRRLAALGRELGIPLVATNNAHYHVRERHRLHDCLVAIRNRKTLEDSHRERRANAEFYLKSPAQMAWLFREAPDALRNTLVIAERCAFDLTRDLTYRFPDYPVPEGFTPLAYLERLCRDAALRKYARVDARVEARLQEELGIIGRRNLAGFFLIYHEIIGMAREVQVELGLVDPEVPMEEAPPGRGRGSSVAMLTGYLIGLSHIDPLQYNLSLERFLPGDRMGDGVDGHPTGADAAPDIDLDFPRNIRERLIERVHQRWGWDHAALTGMMATYQIRGAVRDLGMVLGLPADEVDRLAKQVEHAGARRARPGDPSARQVREEMTALPGFRDKVDLPGWRDLITLAAELDGFPRALAQHPGGMIISSTPLTDQVPVQQSAIDGRYVCHWDKDSIDDAGFVKIDFLALGALSQLQEAVRLIEQRTGKPLDLSRIDFEDAGVYDMLARADTVGIFQVESAAQMQTITRIRPRNLVDMAYEVAAVRPGVGVHGGVSEFIRRRDARRRDPAFVVPYDHPLERRALERTLGIILFQDQMNQVAIDVGGLTPKDADRLRRAYLRRDDPGAIENEWWPRFRDGAAGRGVDEAAAARIFAKFNGEYMFPEAHAFAFGVTAYQAAWLKRYHPLEFFVGLFNQQPMGFYNLETLKEDAKRHGIGVLHPDANRSAVRCLIEGGAIRLGLLNVAGLGEATVEAVVAERTAHGPFRTVAGLMERTGLLREPLDNLVDAGALDAFRSAGAPGRRDAKWEVGLRYKPVTAQRSLQLPVAQDVVPLPEATPWEVMAHEYRTLGLHPGSHLLAYLRGSLPGDVRSSAEVEGLAEGTQVRVAGLVIRRQRPLAKAVFITLEDEHGHIPLVVWPQVYAHYRHVLKEPVLLMTGTVSRREGTMNIVVSHAEAVAVAGAKAPKSKDWG